jgi:hypothetical protein
LRIIGSERALRRVGEPLVVALAKSGDDAAFNELVRRRAGFVRQLWMTAAMASPWAWALALPIGLKSVKRRFSRE